jgi:Cys-tRNA(Pro)/Cys-tRNA(Cys) deacylase
MHPKVYKALNNDLIPYREIRHDSFSFPIISPFDFAKALGYEISRITKSVFLRSKLKDKYIMAVCSIDKKLNLNQLSLLSNTNKLEVADKQELETITDYPPNGVCSIGLAANISVFIDHSLDAFPSILIGSGEPGVEIELSPTDLVKISKANFEDIII